MFFIRSREARKVMIRGRMGFCGNMERVKSEAIMRINDGLCLRRREVNAVADDATSASKLLDPKIDVIKTLYVILKTV